MKYILLLFSLFSYGAYAQAGLQKQQLTEATERRVKDLEKYITTIGDKSIDNSYRNAAVDFAVQLFRSEDNVFQVSSKNRPEIRDYNVRSYFKKLQVLPYTKVEIEWYNTEWVTNYRKAPDGKYYGKVRIYQVFKGYGDSGNLKYTDITSKDIEVVIEEKTVVNYEKEKEKTQLIVWLGDIKVNETK